MNQLKKNRPNDLQSDTWTGHFIWKTIIQS